MLPYGLGRRYVDPDFRFLPTKNKLKNNGQKSVSKGCR